MTIGSVEDLLFLHLFLEHDIDVEQDESGENDVSVCDVPISGWTSSWLNMASTMIFSRRVPVMQELRMPMFGLETNKSRRQKMSR